MLYYSLHLMVGCMSMCPDSLLYMSETLYPILAYICIAHYYDSHATSCVETEQGEGMVDDWNIYFMSRQNMHIL